MIAFDELGMTNEQVQQTLRHSDPKVTNIYIEQGNYKIDMENISEDDTKIASSFRSLSVDGLKARKVRSKNAEEHDAEYSLKTQNGYTSYL